MINDSSFFIRSYQLKCYILLSFAPWLNFWLYCMKHATSQVHDVHGKKLQNVLLQVFFLNFVQYR